MIAMLKDIPPREIPSQPKGPQVSREIMSYKMLHQAISSIFKTCLRKKGDDAKFGWARPGRSGALNVPRLLLLLH